jgi:ArsR family transcriptional regulator
MMPGTGNTAFRRPAPRRQGRAPRRPGRGQPAERLARLFRALGDRHRVRLLSLIAAADGGEACICDLTAPLGLSQPTVSHHMKQLAEAGLVTREQRGKWAYYRVVPEAMAALGETLRGPAA